MAEGAVHDEFELMNRQIAWACGYNAYERLAGGASGPEALGRVLEPARREYARTGRVPGWCGVDLLRGWAFYLMRADYFSGGYDLAEGGDSVPEWRAVLGRVATHPAVRPEERPPLRPTNVASSEPAGQARVLRERVVRVVDAPELAEARRADLDVDRVVARRLGAEAVTFIEQGWYPDPAGHHVDWADGIARARAATASIPPEMPLPAPARARHPTLLVEIANETTLRAAHRLVRHGRRPLVLNMANGLHPGGGFLSGARAQEEYLCRSTGLYATLLGDPMYVAHAARSEPDSTDWVILSPDVPVFRADSGVPLERPWSASFVSSAAPFAPSVGQPRAGDLLDRRIGRVLEVARAYGYSALVLGAWGCGAFGNDPARTADAFRRHLDEFGGAFERVVFAIADWSVDRRFLGPFADAFGVGGGTR